MTKDSLNIAIVGGGIAGLALGCTLKMNSIDCTIFEKSHDVSDYGAGISISRNVLKIFEKLNLIDELRLNSFQPEETIWKYRNKEFLRMPVDIYSMSRQKLFKVFYDKYINLNGDILFNHELKSVSNNGKVIKFCNAQTYNVNHIAACDGIKSIIRENYFSSSKPKYSGFNAWRGTGRADKKDLEFNLGPHTHSVSYPINQKLDRSFVGIVRSNSWMEESWKKEGSIEEFLNEFKYFDDKIISMFSHSSKICKWGIFIREPLKKLFQNNITLLGDAAHPMVPFIGQGGCMAIEDAYIFGILCNKYNSNFTLIQQLYEKIRMSRVNKIQRMSLQQAGLYHIKNSFLAILRNNVMKYTNIIPRRIKFIWDYDADQHIENVTSKQKNNSF